MAKGKKKNGTKIIRISQNSYDSLMFIVSQLEAKKKSPQSFSDAVEYLIKKWCKKHD
jgi:hypothetical protein